MKKLTLLPTLAVLAFATPSNIQSIQEKQATQTLSAEAINALQAKGFNFISMHHPVRSPRLVDSTNFPETVQIQMSFDLSAAKDIEINWLGTRSSQEIATSPNDTIFTESFEGDFPGTRWSLSGNPTWGKSNYQKHSGQNSVFCAQGGTAGVTPPANYPNNMNAMMVFGPFDLTGASLAFMRFWYWLDTEINKDWFYYMASTDGVNFKGIGVSGATGVYSPAWEQTSLNLGDVPELGNLTGKSSVWVAFGFTSDSSGARKGVFVDDVEIQKSSIGTGISGYISGTLTPAGNPYIAFDHIGIAKGDSLSIASGVQIKFYDAKELIVLGYLKATGSVNDSIMFTSNNTTPKAGDWAGIGLYADATYGCQIRYCKIEFAGFVPSYNPGGIFADSRDAVISNCLIWKNKIAGINCGNVIPNSTIMHNKIILNEDGIHGTLSTAKIIENIISQNTLNGIYADLSEFTIRNNEIYDNRKAGIYGSTSNLTIIENRIERNGSYGIFAGGAYLSIPSTNIMIKNRILENGEGGIVFGGLASRGMIMGNLVAKNTGHGVDVSQFSAPYGFQEEPSMIFINNTIADNTGKGFYFGPRRITSIVNNIVSGNNEDGIQSHSQSAYLPIHYNNFYGNKLNFNISVPNSLGILSKINANGDSCDSQYNISRDPSFVGVDSNNFNLQNESPCLNAGTPNAFFNDVDGSVNDIGFTGGSQLYISAYRPEINFGEIVPGRVIKTDLSITNYRDMTIRISSFQLSETTNFSLSHGGSLSIPPHESGRITISYKPQTVGTHSSILAINSSDLYGTTMANIILNGEGIKGTNASGSISGVWDKSGSPYIVIGNATVPEGKKLTIHPGVEIRFDGLYSFSINGQLEAIGAPSDSIIFTRNRPGEYSEGSGLYFSSSADSSKLVYCIIEKMSGSGRYDPQVSKPNAIFAFRSKPLIISYSRISDNYGNAIRIVGTGTSLRQCLISDNGGVAIYVENGSLELSESIIWSNQRRFRLSSEPGAISCKNSLALILNNKIQKHGWNGIYCFGSTNANISNNIISQNGLVPNTSISGAGITFAGDTLHLINNVVYDNTARISFGAGGRGGGISNGGKHSILINNIIWNNHAPFDPQIYNYGSMTVNYCDVQGGFAGQGNIDIDPLFVDPANRDFHLQPNSSCIDAGDPDLVYNDPEDPNRLGFALAPAQGTIRNDMGAYGGQGAAGALVNLAPRAFSLLSPSNGDTLKTLTPIFKWYKAIDPNPGDRIVYQLQIDSTLDFSAPRTFSSITDTTYTLKENLISGATYYWKVIAADSSGLQTPSKEVFNFTTPQITSVEEATQLPTHFDLAQNYPNPFNPETTFKYQLPKDAYVKLEIYSILGQRVATLLNENKLAGYYQVKWDGRDDAGRQLSSGLYFAKLIAREMHSEGPTEAKVRKMVLTR